MKTTTQQATHATSGVLIYRKATLLAKLGISTTTLRRWMAEDNFPKPKQLGPRAVGWIAAQIDEWLDNRPTVDPATLLKGKPTKEGRKK